MEEPLPGLTGAGNWNGRTLIGGDMLSAADQDEETLFGAARGRVEVIGATSLEEDAEDSDDAAEALARRSSPAIGMLTKCCRCFLKDFGRVQRDE